MTAYAASLIDTLAASASGTPNGAYSVTGRALLWGTDSLGYGAQILAQCFTSLQTRGAPASQGVFVDTPAGALRFYSGSQSGVLCFPRLAAQMAVSGSNTLTYVAASWDGVGQITFLVIAANGQPGYVTFNQYRSSVSDALQASALNTTGSGLFYWDVLYAGVRPSAALTPNSALQAAASDRARPFDAALFGTPYWDYPRGALSINSQLFRGIPTEAADNMAAWSINSGVIQALPTVAEALSVSDALAYIPGIQVSEIVSLAASPVGAYGAYVLGRLRAAGTSYANASVQRTISDEVRVRGALLGAFALAIDEHLSVSGAISIAWGVGVAARLVAAGACASLLEAQQVVAAALTLVDEVAAGKGAFASSAFHLSGDPLSALHANPEVFATLVLAAAPQMTLQVFVVAESTALLIDPPSGSTPFGPQQLLDLVVAEKAVLQIGYNAGNGTYVGWVVNTNTQAATQYQGWAFNSFAQFYGKYLGASDAGLMQLGGAQDGAAAIQATLQTAVTDFGSSHKKRVRSAYLGFAAEGTCYLQVLTDDNVERVYQLVSNAPGLGTQRVDLPRGLQSRYWSFTLQSTDGSAWRLDNLEVLPVVLPRRV